MCTNTQGLVNKPSTGATYLCGKAGVHSNHLMSSVCSSGFKDREELTPTSITNRFGKVVVLHQIGDLQVLYRNAVVGLRIVFRHFEMEVSALTADLEMGLCRALGSLTAPVRPFLATAQCALLASQSTLTLAVVPWIVYRVALRVSEKRFQSHINADIGMFTWGWKMLSMWLRLTDDQGIPMPISTQDKMDGFGRALYLAVQLNFEAPTQLLGNVDVLAIRSKQDITPVGCITILSQLDGMPPVGLLEAREANARDMVLFSSKEAFEGFGEAISKHLYRCGWHMLTLPLESIFKVILARECTFLLIVCFDHLKHGIIEQTRLFQALHAQMGLVLIHVKPVLKRSHTFSYI